MKNKILFLILLLAFLIRVLGVKPGLPIGEYPGEVMYATPMEMFKNGDLKPRQYFYPNNVALIHYFIYRVFILPFVLFKNFLPHPRLYLTAIKIGFPRFFREFTVMIFGVRDAKAVYWGRYLAVLFSTTTVFFTYWLGKKLFNRRVGLLAAFFLAFNFRHVLSSALSLLDIPNGLVTMISFYWSFLLWQKPSRRRYLLAGLGAAFVFSTKFQPFALIPFGLAHFFIFLKKPSWRSLFNPNFFWGLLFLPIIFVITNPYFLINHQESLRIAGDVSRRYGAGRKRVYPAAVGFLYQYGIGKLMSGALLLGVVFGLLKYFKKSLLLLAIIFPFLFVFLWYSSGGFWSRNFTAVMPFFLIFAAVGINETAKFFLVPLKWSKKRQALIIFLLAIIVCFAPAKNSLIVTFDRAKEWNFKRLGEWMRKELPNNSKLAIHRGAGWAIGPFADQNKLEFEGFHFNNKDNINLAEWRRAGFDYIILSHEEMSVYLVGWTGTADVLGRQPWRVPVVRMANNFPALVAQEILQWSIADFLKSWQTFENRFVVARIPPDFEGEKKLIKSFHFDQPEDTWLVKGNFDFQIEGFFYNPDIGYKNKGSLQITDKANLNTLRFVSPLIPVKMGEKYRIQAWAKREETKENIGSNGFLRLEFYDQEGVRDLEKVGMGLSLSSRISKTDEWEKLEVSEIVPPNASFMTISFQTGYPLKNILFLDDVDVYQEEITQEEVEFRKHLRPSKADETFLFPLGFL